MSYEMEISFKLDMRSDYVGFKYSKDPIEASDNDVEVDLYDELSMIAMAFSDLYLKDALIKQRRKKHYRPDCPLLKE